MSNIGIIGKGGQAKEITEYCKTEGVDVAFYALDPEYMNDQASDEIVITQPTDEQAQTAVVLSLGAPAVKKEMIEKWPGQTYGSILSSKAHIASTATLGAGSIVAPFGSVGPDSALGKHVYINVGASVPHDCDLGDFVTIGPGAKLGGNVTLGGGCFVGIGSVIKNGVTLAEGCVVGAGAVVLNDVTEPNSVLVGVPAKVIKQNEGWLRAI